MLFAVLYNLRASPIRKFGCLVEIYMKKQENRHFLVFDIFGAKTVKTDVRARKLGFQVVRGALQPQSKFHSNIRLFCRNIVKT